MSHVGWSEVWHPTKIIFCACHCLSLFPCFFFYFLYFLKNKHTSHHCSLSGWPILFSNLQFYSYSSAFKCIKLHILADHLTNTHNLDQGLVSWLVDFLTDRSLRVKVNSILSDAFLSSTGYPQDCVLSPLLFILYTNDCRTQHADRHILKLTDDCVSYKQSRLHSWPSG